MSLIRPLVALTLVLTGCSFIVDDSAYECSGGSCYGCTLHRLCDDDSICVENPEQKTAACQPLRDSTIACNDVYPQASTLRNQDVVLVGLIAQLPTDVTDANYGGPTTLGIRVAIDEINREGGVPIQGGGSRKLLLSVCSENPRTEAEKADTTRREYLSARVRHLVDELRVPAILGPSTTGVSRLVQTNFLADRSTLLLSPSATEDSVTTLPRAGAKEQLFWRTVPPDSRQVPALVRAIDLARDAMIARDPMANVELVSIADVSNEANTNLQDLLTSIAAAELQSTPISRSYDSGSASQRAAIIEELTTRPRPRILVPFTTGDFVGNMLGEIEEALSGNNKPWYAMSEGNRGDFSSVLSTMSMSDLPERVLGTAPGARQPSSALYSAFANAYGRFVAAQASGESSEPGNLAECGYDAAYVLAYALTKASVEASWPDGAAIGRALDTLTDSCPEGQQARELSSASRTFKSQAVDVRDNPDDCFDFNGASGSLNYEPVNDSSSAVRELAGNSSDMAFWCLGAPDAEGDQTRNLSYIYKQSSKSIEPKDTALSLNQTGWCARSLIQ